MVGCGTTLEQTGKVLKADMGAKTPSTVNQMVPVVAVVGPMEHGTSDSCVEEKEDIDTEPTEPLDIRAHGMGETDPVFRRSLQTPRSQIPA